MANVIKCPVCGEGNLPDQEFCQYCQARLQPLTGNLKGADAPITPGQLPTKISTADLEPVLPQWLREARSSARQTAEEESVQAAQPKPASRPASSSGNDFLAGLQSESQDDNEEDDVPDWLLNITGEAPKTKKPQSESSEVRWVELGDKKDFTQPEPVSDDVPSWLTGAGSSTPPPSEKNDLTDWFRSADDSQQPLPPLSTPPVSDPQDWLHSMAADGGAFTDSGNNVADESFTSSDTPDWLRAMDAESATQNVNAPFGNSSLTPDSSDTPDWLRAMDAESAAQNVNAPLGSSNLPPVSSDTPDWLRAMDAESAAQNVNAPFGSSSLTPDSSETPDWLRAMDAESAAQNVNTPFGSSSLTPDSSDTPDWLRAMSAESGASSSNVNVPPASFETPDWMRAMDAQEKPQSAESAGFSATGSGESGAAFSSDGDTPDWLKGLESGASSSDQDWLKGLQADEGAQPAAESAPAWLSSAEPVVSTPEPPAVAPKKEDDALDLPSWLKASAPQSSIFDEPVVAQETPAAPSSDTQDWLNAFKSTDEPQDQKASAFLIEEPVAPTVSKGDDKPDADALFTEMPDWLSIVDDSALHESIPAPITNVDAIAPGDLPSWVQAMRPVDAGVPQVVSTSLSGDKAFESRGALAGLQGVLPAAQGFSPTKKPKAYSIKMNASDEQQAQAVLLEQILTAETAPVSIDSFSAIGTSRVLRWLLAFLFFAALIAVLLMQTQIFSMPVGMPVEVASALQVVQSVPEGAPVLVSFDYEPARVGEMESVVVPMFDQMRNPRLTFISTDATGAILAERFISGPWAGHNYQSGVQYLNLGYLPGGQMGIRAFAENPLVIAPYAINQNSSLLDFAPTSAWNLPPLQGVTSFSQFAAIIIVTDNADSARAWIEQTTSVRGTIPFVVISSAQAAPMIQPYYASQQINGLVSGLYGGALIEQSAGRLGTARVYWDAYGIGMLLAVVLIFGGGLLNFVLGLRDRAAAREAK